MISVPLDPKKLLGFKLIPLNGADTRAAIAIKLGAKVGGKVGVKTMSVSPRS